MDRWDRRWAPDAYRSGVVLLLAVAVLAGRINATFQLFSVGRW